MKHIPFNPTEEQRANLMRLAAHLDLGVTNHQFDMMNYEDANECGTIACAAGHGPSLGIEKGAFEYWPDYTREAFGATWHGNRAEYNAYLWLFAASWAVIDNTPRGAAARIYYALKRGIPENVEDQQVGRTPLSYTVPEFPEHQSVKERLDA